MHQTSAAECIWWLQGCVVMVLYSYRSPTPLLNHAYISRVTELWKVIVVNCYLHAAKVKDSWLLWNISHEPECRHWHWVYISAHVQHNTFDLYTIIHLIKLNQITHWSHYRCEKLDILVMSGSTHNPVLSADSRPFFVAAILTQNSR